MGPVVYALFTYALTAVISFAVIGVVVLIDKVMSRKGERLALCWLTWDFSASWSRLLWCQWASE